jgi:radical SAM protein with 4Fe4S-binding SPASM domain
LSDIEKQNVPLTPNYSLVDLKKFIDEKQRELNSPIADIYFFGGEPTTRYDIISDLVKTMSQIDEKKYKINYILHTNGLLVSNAPREILEKLKVALISINYEEIYENGQMTNYFKKIINSVDKIRLHNSLCSIIARLTISVKSSLYDGSCLTGNFFDYIYWQMDNSKDIIDIASYEKRYKAEIELLYRYWLTFLRKGVFLSYVPFVNAIKNYVWEPNIPKSYYCGYGKSQIYVQTNGDCFACCDNIGDRTHFIGNIKSGTTFPSIDISKSDTCGKCEYIKVCGGRCGRMHIDFSASRIQSFCNMNIFMFDLIKASIPEIKELLIKYPYFIPKFQDENLHYTEYNA